jgi:thiosulfate reductase cytochrome b subunit
MTDTKQTLRLKHLVAIRWFHWINFPLLALMIWSGILIYWAYEPYDIGPFHFFPEWFFNAFGIKFHLAQGMALHFVFMWLFIINGLLYVGYTMISGEWRMLVPRSFTAFRDAWHVLLHDLHLRKEMPPQDKYNAAQQIAYTGIILMGVGSLLTGLAIYKPAQLFWLSALLGGYTTARLLHFMLTIGYVGFFVIHIMQVVLAGWNNFRSMVIGYELVSEND